jgi:hypothetical protein
LHGYEDWTEYTDKCWINVTLLPPTTNLHYYNISPLTLILFKYTHKNQYQILTPSPSLFQPSKHTIANPTQFPQYNSHFNKLF